MRRAIVLGGSGFVGAACVAALRDAGWEVRAEPAPRLETAARTAAALAADTARDHTTITSLVESMDGVDVVVNAAGMPAATAGESDGLFGANALLPALVAAAVRQTAVRRVVYLSSVSVQEGRNGLLDESMQHRTCSPYARSRALGETAAAATSDGRTVILRLPAVLKANSPGQRALSRIARSPLSSTAGPVDRPRPMARLTSVGAAVAFLADYDGVTPSVVLQPAEGFTTRSVLQMFGNRKPVRIPVLAAKAVVGSMRLAGRRAPRLHQVCRGLELMWLGQDQVDGWLRGAGFVPPSPQSLPSLPMKVGVLTHWYKPERVPNPAATAERLARNGHDVKVLTGFPNYPTGVLYAGYRQSWSHRERDCGVDLRRVPLYASHDTNGVRRAANFLSFAATSTAAAWFLADRDVNYVYSSPMTAAAAALVLHRWRGIPYVLHSIDLWPDSALESGMVGGERGQRLIAAVLHSAAGYLYRHAEHVVALTDGMHQILLERGVPPEKLSVIHNWSQCESVDRSDCDPAVRARLGRPDRTLAVFAGNVGLVQDVGTIVRAAALCQDDAPLDVAVIGAGTAFGPARDLAEELGAKNVRFFPRVDAAEMSQVYAASDYQLVTLRDRPLFHATVPSKFTDALSAGCPIITTVPGDAARMCREGGFGFSCAPEDPEALAATFRAACAADDDARAAMRLRARQFYVSDLSMDTALTRLDAVLADASGDVR